MIPVVPAIIPKSETELLEMMTLLQGVPELHVDVVDGKFVPFTSWPYEPAGVPKSVAIKASAFTLEVDLMVEDERAAAEAWLMAGADMLVFHVEAITLAAFRDFANNAPAGVSVIISAKNSTPLQDLLPYVPYADGVQLMGIAEIGAQGQSFDERVLERIIHLKQDHPQALITIDGSVNETTIPVLKAAGANRFICGSAITQAINPLLAYKALHALAN